MSFPKGISMRIHFNMVSLSSLTMMGGCGLFLDPLGLPLPLLEECCDTSSFSSKGRIGCPLPDENPGSGGTSLAPSTIEEPPASVVIVHGVCFEDSFSEFRGR